MPNRMVLLTYLRLDSEGTKSSPIFALHSDSVVKICDPNSCIRIDNTDDYRKELKLESRF